MGNWLTWRHVGETLMWGPMCLLVAAAVWVLLSAFVDVWRAGGREDRLTMVLVVAFFGSFALGTALVVGTTP